MLSGHIRNIHFPFDIEVDTTLAVASEMVEELDLTDQDVSVIADMIDTEIRSHIPDWANHKLSDDIKSADVEGSEFCPTETKDDSPLANESIPSPGNLALERLPSGHEYWSDSPKATGGSSPNKPGHSNFFSYEPLPGSHQEGDHLSTPEDLEADRMEEKEVSDTEVEDNEAKVRDNCEMLNNESDLNLLAQKLEKLLVKRQMELGELRRKHEAAISDLLSEMSPELHQQVLDLCKYKMHDYKIP